MRLALALLHLTALAIGAAALVGYLAVSDQRDRALDLAAQSAAIAKDAQAMTEECRADLAHAEIVMERVISTAEIACGGRF